MSRYFRFYTVEWKQHTSVKIFLESDRNSNGSNIEKEKRKGKELVILHNLKKEWTSKSCEKQKFSWVLGTDRTRNLNAARSLFSLTYCCFFALCQFFFFPHRARLSMWQEIWSVPVPKFYISVPSQDRIASYVLHSPPQQRNKQPKEMPKQHSLVWLPVSRVLNTSSEAELVMSAVERGTTFRRKSCFFLKKSGGGW